MCLDLSINQMLKFIEERSHLFPLLFLHAALPRAFWDVLQTSLEVEITDLKNLSANLDCFSSV